MTKSIRSYGYFPFIRVLSIWTILLWLILSSPALNLPTNDTNATNTSSLHTIDGLQPNGCYCRKLKWYEFVLFYALNYGAHAFSVITPPGSSLRRSVIWVIYCLCFPYVGVGMPAILLTSLKRWPWNEDPFQKALRAGALCMVVRTSDWRPLDNGTTIPASHLRVVKPESAGQRSNKLLIVDPASVSGGIPTAQKAVAKFNRYFLLLGRNEQNPPYVRVIQPNPVDQRSNAPETDSQIPPGTYELLIAYGSRPTMREMILIFQEQRHPHARLIQSNRVGQHTNVSKAVPQISPGTHELLVADDTLAPTKTTFLKMMLSRLKGFSDCLKQKLKETTVHGQNHLPKGFKFATIPTNTKVRKNYHSLKDPKLTHSPQTVKSLISFGQVCVAIFTLIRVSSGCGQLQKYGFVSPALTIIPYAIMSLVNAIGNITTPYYPTQYVVGSRVLDEAKLYGGEFDTIVGRLEELENNDHTNNVILLNSHRNELIKVLQDTNDQSQSPITHRNGEAVDGVRQEKLEDGARERNDIHEPYQKGPDNNESATLCGRILTHTKIWGFAGLILLILLIAPFTIIWGLTHFNKGGSTATQRKVITAWLVFGQFGGLVSLTYYLMMLTRARDTIVDLYNRPEILLVILCYAIPSIWGFIIVGHMLQELGECTQLL